jgi:hypothetical protein
VTATYAFEIISDVLRAAAAAAAAVAAAAADVITYSPNWHGTQMPGCIRRPARDSTATLVLGFLHPANCIATIAE